MAYSPISSVPIQYSKADGTPANGYYLKFYLANSSTPISMQTDSGGATSIAKAKLNESGYPISNPNDENTVFIPHLSTTYTAYRFVLYASAADADANNVTSGLPNIQSVAINQADDLRADLAASSGSSLAGFKQSGANTITTNVESILINSEITPQQFGAVGDGVTDDTEALQNMFNDGRCWAIPYTEGGYLFNDTLTIKSSGICHGRLLADTGFSTLAVNFADVGYQGQLIVRNLKVHCKSARTANSIGIRVAYPGVILDRCSAKAFDYGIQVWSYSVMLLNCAAYMCKTNVSAYAPAPTSEINDLKIIGGNFDSATEYSIRIGDPRFSTTVPSGELMGTTCTLLGCAFDAATATFDRIYSLNVIGCYWEGASVDGKAVILGGAGNGWMRNVTFEGCYFAGALNYAIYCNSPIRGLNIKPNYYGGGMISALYVPNCELYGFNYQQGANTSGFQGPEVSIGFGSITVGQLTFAGITNSCDFLTNGVQLAPSIGSTENWYPYGKTQDGNTQYSSSVGRFKTNPVSGISGTFSGATFTCSTISDSLNFNGGDRITASAGGFSFVQAVNYSSGVLTLGGGSHTGAGTISQDAAVFRNINLTGWSAPASGTWRAGDIVYSSAPTAGGYIGWVCITSGTPGTWKTFGSITP